MTIPKANEPVNPGRKLPTRSVCTRYGVVSRSLDRWGERPELNFPRPLYINGRKYWAEDELDSWDRMRAVLSASGQVGRKNRRKIAADLTASLASGEVA